MGCRLGVLLSLFFFCGTWLGCTDSEAENAKTAKREPLVPGPVDPDAPEEFTTTESGLKYRIRRKSTGRKPAKDQIVTIHFRGWTDDGNLFESSYGSAGSPRSFEITNMVPGFVEGILLIGEGGMIELEVPPNLGYAAQGMPPVVPPNSTLHFLIEMISFNDATRFDRPKSDPIEEGMDPGSVDADAPIEFTTTDSGLKYRIRRKSEGKKPSKANTVKVKYRGWLDNGSVFDTTYHDGLPREFGVGQVIPGWTEGLQLIGEGGMIELEIPSKLGYGPSGQAPKIPGDATLHFLVELLDVH